MILLVPNTIQIKYYDMLYGTSQRPNVIGVRNNRVAKKFSNSISFNLLLPVEGFCN